MQKKRWTNSFKLGERELGDALRDPMIINGEWKGIIWMNSSCLKLANMCPFVCNFF